MGRITLKGHESIRSADTKNGNNHSVLCKIRLLCSNHDLKVPSTFRVFMSLAKMLSAGSDKEHSIYDQNANSIGSKWT